MFRQQNGRALGQVLRTNHPVTNTENMLGTPDRHGRPAHCESITLMKGQERADGDKENGPDR